MINHAFVEKVTKKVLFQTEHRRNLELVASSFSRGQNDKCIEKAIYKLMKQVQNKRLHVKPS